jgi:hypothetical protein
MSNANVVEKPINLETGTETECTQMLDLFYLAVGGLVLFVFWAFTKACDRF